MLRHGPDCRCHGARRLCYGDRRQNYLGCWCCDRLDQRASLPEVIRQPLFPFQEAKDLSLTEIDVRSEIAPASQRGKFVVMNHIGFVVGLATGFWYVLVPPLVVDARAKPFRFLAR